jgi:cystathionine beta-lyase
MPYNFDQPIERRSSGCAKWNYYDEDVIPMWVADMDFQAPEPILQAMHERIEHGVFGYGYDSQGLIETICARMDQRYQWQVSPDEVVLLPGVVSSFNRASLAFAGQDGGVLMQVPVYPPFLSAPENQSKRADKAELSLVRNGTLRYEIDFERFEAAIQPSTGMFLLCNPHNPIGRAYTREELSCMAEICAPH